MAYKIEKNQLGRIPPKKVGGLSHLFPDLKEMKVTDSFLIPKNDYTSESAARMAVYNAAITFNRANPKTPIRLVIRKEDKGLRVWRSE